MNAKVDAYLRDTEKWRDEFVALRKIILTSGLDEELKCNPPKLRLFNNFSDSSPCAVFGLGFVVLRDFHGGDRSVRQSSRALPAAVCGPFGRSLRQAGELAAEIGR